MHHHHGQLGPPLTLAERLEQLNNNLQAMSARLKEAIASAISTTVAGAVRDAIQGLLGSHQILPRSQDNRWQDERWSEDDNRSWSHRSWNDREDDPWQEREFDEPQPQRRTNYPVQASNRLSHALTAAAQTSLWWLCEQKNRRPVLTTSVVALTAGMTAFFYGPALAAGVGMLASVASLLMTADGSSSAAQRLAEMTAD